MNEAGERQRAKDACASRAKPRLEERVCERGRRPTLNIRVFAIASKRAHRRARRRVIERGRSRDATRNEERAEAAK